MQSTTLTNRNLLDYLKELHVHAGFVDRLKITYRPLICPFTELISLVNEGERVGDIGCGSGQFCLLLARFAKPSFIYGIEINDRLVSNANQLFEQHGPVPYQFEKFDGVVFPETISTLDTVFLNDVLHHVPRNSQEQFTKNLISMMKPGARLILKDIDGGSAFVYANKLHDLVFAGEIGNERPYWLPMQWLKDSQMEITQFSKKRMYVYPHYIIIGKKK